MRGFGVDGKIGRGGRSVEGSMGERPGIKGRRMFEDGFETAQDDRTKRLEDWS